MKASVYGAVPADFARVCGPAPQPRFRFVPCRPGLIDEIIFDRFRPNLELLLAQFHAGEDLQVAAVAAACVENIGTEYVLRSATLKSRFCPSPPQRPHHTAAE